MLIVNATTLKLKQTDGSTIVAKRGEEIDETTVNTKLLALLTRLGRLAPANKQMPTVENKTVAKKVAKKSVKKESKK